MVAPADLGVSVVDGVREVSIAAGEAIILGTTAGARQGAYCCYNDAPVRLPVAAADPTNGRYDLVIAQVRDGEYAGADNDWRLAVLTGTPAAAPVDPILPDNSLVLSRILVAAGDATLSWFELSDRRPLARVGSLLARSVLVTSGSSSPGLHDSGLAVGFIMPLLASGQRVELRGSAYGVVFSSSVPALTSVQAILRVQANPLAYSYIVMPGASNLSALPSVRRTIDNTDYPAGTYVRIELATASSSNVSHSIYAGSTFPAELTATIV